MPGAACGTVASNRGSQGAPASSASQAYRPSSIASSQPGPRIARHPAICGSAHCVMPPLAGDQRHKVLPGMSVQVNV
ncbi:hypothetical protein G6F62_015052 [Rhizopus arrhizus]|nr:hypothetical protein G6F62_015052 [Rhizopus arrhizus]